MSRLTDLLRAAKQLDPQLGADLEEELKPLQKRLPFGLNFERHAPEAVELAGHKIRKTSKVRVLPPRGSTARGDQRLWSVESITNEVAEISLLDTAEPETAEVLLDDLVLVAEFRDRIYPGLRQDGTVARGGEKPFHTLINGENFHVLEQLTFTHEHAVDVIYIDPPYNSGARDWKYNNDYVEGDDLYRHSKWLAFIERRLKIAKRLLKPHDSVLIVAIDEKEYLRLGLLLEQNFPEGNIQMVSTVTNRKGSARAGGFSRVDEYLFYVRLGAAEVLPTSIDVIGLGAGIAKERLPDIWNQLMRRGSGSARSDRPMLFYPIYVDPERRTIAQIGSPLRPDQHRSGAPSLPGLDTVLPMRSNGDDGRWSVGPEALQKLVDKGYAKVGLQNRTTGLWTINYLIAGDIQKVNDGEIVSSGRDESGAHILKYADISNRLRTPKTIWNIGAHDATEHGKTFLTGFLGGRSFPYPKSLYAVEDSLRFVLKNKPDAVVLDFFAGSGTTAHAVMRLNRQDGGERQAILVTNNEVAADEQRALRERGLRPGDAAWEEHGICDYITKPRIRAAVTGRTPENEPIKGDYKFVDVFPIAAGFEENAAFFTLTYESPWSVGNDRAFSAIAPMLWLRAGARGSRIDALADDWAVADTYGILKDLDQASEFIAALQEIENLRIAYIVTDDEGRYQQVADELSGVETVRLYEDYLRNCESTGDF